MNKVQQEKELLSPSAFKAYKPKNKVKKVEIPYTGMNGKGNRYCVRCKKTYKEDIKAVCQHCRDEMKAIETKILSETGKGRSEIILLAGKDSVFDSRC